MNDNNSFQHAPTVHFFGIVKDIVDPKKLGRVKVLCHGFYDDIETSDLPWAYVSSPTNVSNNSGLNGSPLGLLVGTRVHGWFMDGSDCQQPLIVGTLPTIMNEGAVDNEYDGKTSVNTLATGDGGQNVDTKRSGVDIVPVTAILGTGWTEPTTKYAADYTFNNVYQGVGGNIVEVDDTKGAERINIEHKSGSFIEMHPNGDVVIKSKNDIYTLIDGSGNVYIKGDYNLNIDGSARIKATGKLNVEALAVDWFTQTNFKMVCGGDFNIVCGGIMGLNATQVHFNNPVYAATTLTG
jgi:hypothetical protein